MTWGVVNFKFTTAWYWNVRKERVLLSTMGAHFKLKKPSFAALLRQVLKLETKTINNERKNNKLKKYYIHPCKLWHKYFSRLRRGLHVYLTPIVAHNNCQLKDHVLTLPPAALQSTWIASGTRHSSPALKKRKQHCNLHQKSAYKHYFLDLSSFV